jgi:hypothetical protein
MLGLEWLATGWMVRGLNPGGDKIFRTLPDRPSVPPSLLYKGHRVFFPGIKRSGLVVNHIPLPAPRLKKEYSRTPTVPLGLQGLF